jgi:hypothetical protein
MPNTGKIKDSKDKDVITEKTGSAPHNAQARQDAVASPVASVTSPPGSSER